MSRCPSTSARSSTSPWRRSNWRRSSLALVSFNTSPSKELTCSSGTKTCLAATAATRPVSSGWSAPRSRTMMSASFPIDSPRLSVIALPNRSDRCSTRPSPASGAAAAGDVVMSAQPFCFDAAVVLPTNVFCRCHSAICWRVWGCTDGMKATSNAATLLVAAMSGGTTGVATIRAAGLQSGREDLGESLGYAIKRRLLGPPLVNEQLREERLSKPLALGVLAPDGISSSAYGTEEILIELLKGGLGIAAFALILPLTGVVLFVMALVVLSYREVVTIYTRAGGSYVVARENFGPRVAQVAAVALLIDYVVTVAVKISAGTAAVASAIPALNHPDLLTGISIGIVLLMLYGNLRGIREAGRTFAVPTYLFASVMILVIVVGLIREIFGNLPLWNVHNGVNPYGANVPPNHSSLITFGLIFILLRAFANGGSSLTGIEAVSNAVSAFRKPEGLNARKVLVTEGLILGTLVAGVSWLAHVTHATPYVSGVPTVIAQEAKLVFAGTGWFGSAMFILVQAATALILYTGGNTSFNGFPFLANFVAEDAFLPCWQRNRGH